MDYGGEVVEVVDLGVWGYSAGGSIVGGLVEFVKKLLVNPGIFNDVEKKFPDQSASCAAAGGKGGKGSVFGVEEGDWSAVGVLGEQKADRC